MRKLRWVLFALYCLFIVWYTVLSRRPTSNHRVQWELFWSYIKMFTGDPNWMKDVIQNLQNIAFFIPFGFFLPVKKWSGVLVIALLFSACIETVQYIGGFGLAEIDDVICNTLGAMIGYWAWTCLMRRSNETAT